MLEELAQKRGPHGQNLDPPVQQDRMRGLPMLGVIRTKPEVLFTDSGCMYIYIYVSMLISTPLHQ